MHLLSARKMVAWVRSSFPIRAFEGLTIDWVHLLQRLDAPLDYSRGHLSSGPAHSGFPENKKAHDAARGFIDRADVTNTLDALLLRRSGKDRLVTYRDVLNHYRLGRAEYPAAGKTLSRRQAVAWRLLQANTFPNLVLHNHCYPAQYSSACKQCGNRASLQHKDWACRNKGYRSQKNKGQKLTINIRSSEQWEIVQLSSDRREQVRLVQMAEGAAREGLLAAD